MNPKCIIIKTTSKEFYIALTHKLKEFKNIRFSNLKINGFYTVIIKCHNYYDENNQAYENALYGSYTFLYSIISIILSELLLTHFENSISKRIVVSQKFKHNNINTKKLSTISSLLLDNDSPFEFSKILYSKRRKIILNTTLENFRKHNFIFIDHFLDFSSKEYINELNDIIDVSMQILENKSLYNYMMNYIFQNH